MAYRVAQFFDFDLIGPNWQPDEIGFEERVEASSLFGTFAFELPTAIAQPNYSLTPFTGQPALNGYTPLDHATMLALFGEDSAYAQYDAANFAPGQAFTTVHIPGLSAPTSNAFASTISVSTGGNSNLDQYVQQVMDLTQAALDQIGQFMNADSGAILDVAVTLAQQGPSTVASAGSGALYLNGNVVDGVNEVVTVSQREFEDGVDPNGSGADIVVTINTDFLESSQAFLETGPNRMPGANQIDYVSVLVHEIMHGLGFFAFRDNSGADVPNGNIFIESTFGLNIDFGTEDGTLVPRYDSDNIQDVYGEAVLMEYLFNSGGSDVSHFGRFEANGDVTDLRFALMNPSVVLGDVVTFGAIELAILRDLGYDIQNDANVELVNSVGNTANDPEFTLTPNILVSNAIVFLEINSTATGTGSDVASLGVSATLSDGTVQSDRLTFSNSQTVSFFDFEPGFLEALGDLGGGDIDIRTFYAANAELASGNIEETTTITFETMVATNGNDTIVGTFDSDRLVGAGGFDDLRGGPGDDIILGGNGNDFMTGGVGADLLFGGVGNDVLRGDDGEDFLYGNSGRDTLRGGDGADFIFGGDDRDAAFGGAGKDIIFGGTGNDRLYGEDGNDTIYGEEGVDLLVGGIGVDRLFGGSENDTLRGDEGNDFLYGGAGLDRLFGGADDDTLFGQDGDDTLYGGDGIDTISGGEGDDVIYGEIGSDTLNGNNGNDRIFGGEGDDTLLGGADNDRLLGNEGVDTMDGGSGNDLLGGGIGDDIMDGNIGDDTLLGGDGEDNMLGGIGEDRLFGGNENDVLDGGAGNDRLNGGNGSDEFVFNPGYGVDIIQDFEDGLDMINAGGYTQSEIQTAIDNAFMASIYLILDFGNGDQLRIANVVDGDITLDDFV